MTPTITPHCHRAAGGLEVPLGAWGGLGAPLGGRETPAQNGLCWGGVQCFGTTPVAPQLDWFFRVMTGHFKWCFPPVAAGISLKK